MPHEVMPGPLPNIVQVRMYGRIDMQDVSLPIEELGPHNGKIYILMDVREVSLSLPSGTLDAARNGLLVHGDVAHISLVTSSRLVDALANMLAKLAGRKNHISIQPSVQAAMDHLVKLAGAQH